ncbi:hemerythrin domain-containing protein [Candidatus Pacearchaeota archaeon]|nr:hemerythrin domain-containing protein [Candidatus Pacearchaeota archaeon]
MKKMENATISKIMTGEHNAINSLLDELWINLDNERAKAIFGKLKWMLEKHFYLEEKAIFDLYTPKNDKDLLEVAELVKQHEELKALFVNIGEAIEHNIKPDLRVFEELAKRHAKFEDEIFYPKLDLELGEEQKAKIIDKSREIINSYYKAIE